MSEAPDSELFMSRVEALLTGDGAAGAQLSPLGAGLLVAVDLGIADSRSFSRQLGIEHALVLREIADLSGPAGLIVVTARNEKTLRTSLTLSARGSLLLRASAGRSSLRSA